MSTAKQILYGVKVFCEEKGIIFSVRNTWDNQLAFEAIREQWFKNIEFIDIHQAGFTSITDEDMDFHNQGINPYFQSYKNDFFMLNID